MEQNAFMVFALCILKLQIKYLENCFCVIKSILRNAWNCRQFDAKGQVYNYIFIASVTAIVFSVPVLTLTFSYMTTVSF